MIDRTFTIPLRKGFLKKPKYKRAKKAMTVLREYLIKHMKSQDIRIGPHLNKKVWEHGMRNPPHHVTVQAKKDDEGVVRVELSGFEYIEKKKAKKEEKPAGSPMMQKLQKLTQKEAPEKETKSKKSEIDIEDKEPETKPTEKKPAVKEEKPAPKKETPKPEPKKETKPAEKKPEPKKEEKK